MSCVDGADAGFVAAREFSDAGLAGAELAAGLFGPDGMVARYTFWDDKYLFGMGGGPDAMEAAVKAVETRGRQKQCTHGF